MTAHIPVSLVEGWIINLTSYLEQASQEAETPTDLLINKGMRHGVAQIESRLKTWRRHQKYAETLNRLGRKFLMIRRVNLSDGRYRKLEWYQDDLFVTLAWRHGMHEETGELMLEIQDTRDLSKTYLVYEGNLTFDDLAGLARKGGLASIKTEETQGKWVEKVWT